MSTSRKPLSLFVCPVVNILARHDVTNSIPLLETETLMFHRPNHPIARVRGREMHNALTEGNGITKHIACRYGNVNPPQVAFLSALCPLTDACIPFLFYPLFCFWCSITYAKVCVVVTLLQNIYRFRKFCQYLLSSRYFCLSLSPLHIKILSYPRIYFDEEVEDNVWLWR